MADNDREALAELIAEMRSPYAGPGGQSSRSIADAILARWRLVPAGSDAELVLLHHEGLTDREIGQRFGCATRSAAARRRKLGLEVRVK